ncbi:MAG: 4'-phosphopantetheinyl transferase superfamily protein [Desulfobacter sp.]|nr:MAG: 4'-phosphopantetheinyl transferase superfamily protein [Desulfobacter sp.]
MAEPLENSVQIRIRQIPELIRDLSAAFIPEAYQAMRPLQFDKAAFTCAFLTPEELARLNEFKALKKQVEWFCGRYSAKSLAKEILMPEQAENQITIAYMEEGAPYLTEFPRHCLSLSHSGIYTAAALAEIPDMPMGIDLEKMGPRPGSAFMKTAFTQKEIRQMGNSSHALFTAWTLKEAYLKYIRKGFNESLHQVEVLGGRIFHGGRAQDLDCRTWELDGGYLLSGAFRPGTAIHFSKAIV